MVAAEVFTEAAVAGDFMEAAGVFTAEEVSPEGAALVSAAAARLAGIVAAGSMVVVDSTVAVASTVVEASMVVVASTVAASMVGASTVAVALAGDLDLAGRIGDMAGAIRMATMARGITRPTVIMVTRPAGLRTT